MGRVQDKVAIVTGGAGGLGAEDARLLASEGARVVLTDLDEERGRAVAGEIGGDALFLRHDIASEDDWRAVVAETEERFGGVDILVNNAGILLAASIEETTVDVWEKIMRVNAQGYFLGCKYGLQAMRKRSAGSIVNMGSLAGVAGMSAFCAYSASKGAVTAMTRNIAAYCRNAKLDVRCNVIHPDGIKTPMISGLYENPQPGSLPQVGDANQAMTRMAEPRDIANLVLFLASDESRFINGAEVRIDNAWTIWADR